jgi:HJR/Mrr/RecB family endonuclease|tara:strand:- start:3121 stop:3312 length:192 start_codon:yes stop_codon:yes gene_type:complete
MHHRVKLQLDAICQEAGDMNVEEFMEVYKYYSQKQQILMTNIDRSFQEEMINDMDMGEPLYRL